MSADEDQTVANGDMSDEVSELAVAIRTAASREAFSIGEITSLSVASWLLRAGYRAPARGALDRVGAGAWDAAAWEARERGLFYTAEFNALIALNPYRAALTATEDGK